MRNFRLTVFSVLLVAILLSSHFLFASSVQTAKSFSYQPVQPSFVPPSLTLLGAGASWAAQNGTKALFVDWEDNYLTHGNTDGINWGPWPSETLMINWTESAGYALNQSGLTVTFTGDIPSDLTGYNVVIIAAYWACTPSKLAEITNYIAGGGGVVLLAGVPEVFRTYSKSMWTYNLPTDPLSENMDQVFACDGDYFNTGGYANVTVDNPFNTTLMSGDTLFESAGSSNAGVANPYNGSQILAEWNPGLYGFPNFNLTVAFAYTYQYGLGRVYYQASYDSLDPPNHILGDFNNCGKVDMKDVAKVAKAYGTIPGDTRWSPAADLNFDGKVNMQDINLVCSNFGKHN